MKNRRFQPKNLSFLLCARHSSKTALRPVWTGRQKHSRKFPNSSGVLLVIDGTYGIFSSESEGVFNVMSGTNKINVTVSGGYQGNNHANFDLSGGNSIYGDSDTVQPKTLRGYALIRYL